MINFIKLFELQNLCIPLSLASTGEQGETVVVYTYIHYIIGYKYYI